MKHAVQMGSRVMIYVPSLIKIGSGIQKLIGGYTEKKTATWSHKATLCFQTKESRLKNNNSSIVACVFVAALTFLLSRCLATIWGFLSSRCLATIGWFLQSHCLPTIMGLWPGRCLATIKGFLPSRCLTTLGGSTDTHTQSNVIS
jgi:hypothetical protein